MSLQFSDTTNKSGLLQECEFNLFGTYGSITDDSDLPATFTRLINNGVNRVASLIMQADHRWQWDDNNNTDFPIATASLVANQQDYAFDVSFLKVLRAELKDENGNWTKLIPFDQSDLYDQSLTDFLSGSGVPQYYDKVGNSVFLYPKPSYSQSLSLKVYFQRPPSYFVSTDTTKVPGFNSLFHRLVALIASRDYALMKQLSNAKVLSELVSQGEQDLMDYYTLRNKDELIKISRKKNSFK